MRILHLVDYFQPLMGYQETHLARVQASRGHDVRVVTSDRYAPVLYRGGASDILGERKVGPRHTKEDGIDVVRLDPWFEIHNTVFLRGLKDAVLDFRPDVIHAHEFFSMNTWTICRLKNRLGDTKIVVDEHKTYSERNRRLWARVVYGAFHIAFGRRIERTADSLVAVTEETKRLMVDLYRIRADRIQIIPLGCDTSRFAVNSEDGRRLRSSLGIPEGRLVLCYVGRLSEEKGVHLLVEAALRLVAKGHDVHVITVGGANQAYRRQMEDRITSSGTRDRFAFLPPVPNQDLPKYYSVASIGVWPRQCSLAMLEAMSCGLPIVISDRCGAPERASEFQNGLLYREDDVADLASKLEELVDPRLRESMGGRSRKAAEEMDWGRISDRFESLYAGTRR